ncbi:MAG: hypothetical protein WCF18_09355 [Chthoniobacteraceae bacterium]
MLKFKTGTPNEYFLVENRSKLNRATAVPFRCEVAAAARVERRKLAWRMPMELKGKPSAAAE